MNVCIVFPPVFDPSMPYLAPYLLQTYLQSEFPNFTIDVVDLNIIFFNSIITNPYANFNHECSEFDTYQQIVNKEKEINVAFSKWSARYNIKLLRQAIVYPIDQDNSVDVKKYIHSDNSFNSEIRNLLIEKIDIKKYDVFGISISSYDQVIPSLIIANQAKKTKNEIITVVGGNIVSRIWNKLLDQRIIADIDFIIRMEGELPFSNLLKLLTGNTKLTPTNNLIDAKKYSVIDCTEKQNIANLEDIPTPEFKNIEFNYYFSPIPVIPLSFSRGCSWGKCSFCGIYSGWCTKYRTKPVKKMVNEIRYYVQSYGINTFRLVDEALSIRDIIEFSKEIVCTNLDVRIEAYLNIEKNLVNESNAKLLYQAGFRQFFFGLESLDRRVLVELNKGINDPRNYSYILDNLHKNGISNYGFFMIGLPNDTIKNEETLEDFIISNDSLSTIAISSYIPITNSKLFNDIEFNKKYGVTYFPRGDLTTRCEYLINGNKLDNRINEKIKHLLLRIFNRRKDLLISSNIPYESRFYLINKYGNTYAKKIASDSRFDQLISSHVSDELKFRASGLKGENGNWDD